jgi:hypothetical protein
MHDDPFYAVFSPSLDSLPPELQSELGTKFVLDESQPEHDDTLAEFGSAKTQVGTTPTESLQHHFRLAAAAVSPARLVVLDYAAAAQTVPTGEPAKFVSYDHVYPPPAQIGKSKEQQCAVLHCDVLCCTVL